MKFKKKYKIKKYLIKIKNIYIKLKNFKNFKYN